MESKLTNGTCDDEKDGCSNHRPKPMNLHLNTNSRGSKVNSPKTPQKATPLLTPRTPPVTPDSPKYDDDDVISLRSCCTSASLFSCNNDHHSVVPRNGTTYSGRHQKYVYHCSQYAGQSGAEYLTPTQRAQKQLRRLRELLSQAKLQIDEKESEILKLTQEVIELRSFKASLASPEEGSNSSDAVTVKENGGNDFANSSNDASPITADVINDLGGKPNGGGTPDHYKIMIDKTVMSEMHSSFADSGLFEDIQTQDSKEEIIATRDQATGVDNYIDEDRQALIEMYERKIEDLIKINDCEKQDVAQKYNDKIESLLQKLAEANTRLHTMFPDLEQAKERVHELERELEMLQAKLEEQEDKANKMYLHMMVKDEGTLQQKNQAAAMVMSREKVTVSDLVDQLHVTHQELSCLKDADYANDTHSNLLSAKEAISLWLLGAKKEMYGRLAEAQQQKHRMDPEVKLQFLKSAIFYLLTSTDKDNSDVHLNAIENILEFSEAEKERINKFRRNAYQQ